MTAQTPPNPAPDANPAITREMIRGFVDGELPRDDHARVLEALMSDPAVAALVQTEQRLRQTLEGCMDCKVTMRCPDALKSRLSEICDECESDTTEVQSHEDDAPLATLGPDTDSPAPLGVRGSEGWGRPALALAAMFLVGTALIVTALNAGNRQPAPGLGPAAAMLAPDLPMLFAKRHVACGTGIIELMTADDLVASPDVLPAALAARFGAQPTGSLDLGPTGFALVGVGECYVPGKGAVHAMYATTTPGRADGLSLWLIAHDPAVGMEPATRYTVMTDEMPHPMIMWSDGSLDYYLVGDDYDTLGRVASVVSASLAAHEASPGPAPELVASR
ncbi:MAG: hypothetical protein AAF078_07950 [Planctomycetota bacterium]